MGIVKNYTEYTNLLKATFDWCERMPAQRDIQHFIDSYSLYEDWRIIVSDVAQDIRAIILNPKAYKRLPKEKQISSYRQYLEKLHETFGIPATMPELSRISAFIDEYELFMGWGITEEDVTKDLQGFIDGNYDEMHKDAKLDNHPISAPTYTYNYKYTDGNLTGILRGSIDEKYDEMHKNTASVTHTMQYQRSSYTYSSWSSVYTPPAMKQEKSKREERPKSRKNERKKPAVKVKTNPEKQKTIFVDGDNNINEGLKGVERLPKNVNVRVVFSQPGTKRKFDNKYRDRPNLSSKLVKPGNQAVDNQIKTEAGQLLKKGNQDITFVSHDRDFAEYGERKKNRKDGNRITVVKSVKNRKPK